jgi:hypothetical protein
VEHPVGEEVEVGFAVGGIVGAGGDGLVDALVFLVVTGVDDDLTGLGDADGGVLVADSAEPGVLAGLRLGIEWVDLNDPAVVLGRLGVVGIVEPAVSRFGASSSLPPGSSWPPSGERSS